MIKPSEVRAMILFLLFAVLRCQGLKEKGKLIPRNRSEYREHQCHDAEIGSEQSRALSLWHQ